MIPDDKARRPLTLARETWDRIDAARRVLRCRPSRIVEAWSRVGPEAVAKCVRRGASDPKAGRKMLDALIAPEASQ